MAGTWHAVYSHQEAGRIATSKYPHPSAVLKTASPRHSRNRMVELAGVEPAACGLEIRYSVRLSYSSILAELAGVGPTTSRFVAWRSIQLSYSSTLIGGTGGSRTPDPGIKSAMLCRLSYSSI